MKLALKVTHLGLLFFSINIISDSFIFNTHNNHGSIGLINMPTSRFYEEGAFSFTLYDGTPDQKITMTAQPYDWFEAAVFYTNIQDLY